MRLTGRPRPDHERVTEPDRAFTPGRILAAVPDRLRPRAALLLGHQTALVLLRTAGELVRVQIFDRSMTLAAQAFTSIFPVLIMIGALSGGRARDHLDSLVRLPASSTRLLDEALAGSRSNAFGVFGSLIVILSATGLARALVRAYRAIWAVPGRRVGARATAWQIGSVLILVGFLVAVRLLGTLAGRILTPVIAGTLLALLADVALAALLPRILLGPAVGRLRLLLTGVVFGAIMLAVRPAGHLYLPRALESSSQRYGTIGLAFTYIGWLYVLSFCLLLSAVAGGILADLGAERFTRTTGRATRWSGRSTQVKGQSDLGQTGQQTAGAGQQDQGAERQRRREHEDDSDDHGQRPDDDQGGPHRTVRGGRADQQGQAAEDPGGREDDREDGQAGHQVPQAD
ncbi:hypothetical protein GCM10010109_35520 [Actinoplanes campanulatus]|nr:hypothetical protein GCM10010109_35520 [Actinoplanes campanulatus]GID35598.1 hypothetical protein Aca09nite_21040 [Actinoplanes campanulatus]